MLELGGEAAGEEPACDGRAGAADGDEEQAERLAVDGEVHADAEHGAADDAAGDARRDAEPEDFAAGYHETKVACGARLTTGRGFRAPVQLRREVALYRCQ